MSSTDSTKRQPARRFAHVLLGVSLLLLLSLGAEAVARLVSLPLPGSVIGLVILVCIMLSPIGDRVEKVIAPGADVLVVMLPLLLVPLAVGVMDMVGSVGDALGGLAMSLVGGWLAAFMVTAGVHLIFRRRAHG